MSGISGVTRGLALCCASRFEALQASLDSWSCSAPIFRAGVLMPADLFMSPSLREAVSYVTITPLAHTYEALAAPLGQEWEAGFFVPPVIEAQTQAQCVVLTRQSDRPAPGIVALLWEAPDGARFSARHVVQEGEPVASIASALSRQVEGLGATDNSVRVSSGILHGMVGGYGRSRCLIRRQSQRICLSIWTSQSETRNRLGDAIRDHLLPRDWLDLPDGDKAQILFDGEAELEVMQNQALFRRDMKLRVIWDDHAAVWTPQMLAGGGWVQSPGTRFVIGDVPDGVRDRIPVAALDRLAAVQAMPTAYRDWCVDACGTVQPCRDAENSR